MATPERSRQPSHARFTPLTQWPLRRFSGAAAAAHTKLLAQPAGPLHWSACEERRQRSLWWVQLAVNDAPVRLHVQSRSLDNWAASVAGPQVPPALVSAGVAHGGAPLWQALSSALNAPVQFIQARSMNALTVPDDALAWQLPSLGWRGVLYAGADSLWQRLVCGVSDKPSASPGDGLMEVPLQITFGVGRTRLNSADFARLRRHCVVLVDEAGSVHRHRDLLRLGVTVLAGPGRHRAAYAVWVDNALYRVADFSVVNSDDMPSPPSGADVNSSDEQATQAQAQTPTQDPPPAPRATAPPHQAPDLTDVEVDVRFEIGRQRWPLRQLVQWRVGQPVPLELALRDTPVTAWVHERCIASGRLVVIGERLGVRLDDVFSPLAKPAAPRADSASANDRSRVLR
jgi:flagellar motor switch/type III secretory pathway protein FliN